MLSYIVYGYCEDMLFAKKFPHRIWIINKVRDTFMETAEIYGSNSICLFLMQNLGKVVITMQITKMNLILNEDCSTKLIKEYSKEYIGLDNLDTPEKVADVMNKFFELDKQEEECCGQAFL